MRDPTAINPKVAEAVEDATAFLGLLARLGALDGRPAFKDASPEQQAEFDRQCWLSPDPLTAKAQLALALPSDMSEDVRAHIEQVLLEKAKADRDNHGSDRDYFIVSAVAELVKRGFRPYRRGRRESACSIVTTALARLGIYKSERTIEDIWTNREDRAPFDWSPLWASIPQNVRKK
jgi:hypothetical protein